MSQPGDYEVRRGYLKVGATTRLRVYEQLVRPRFLWIALTDADWQQAAQFWADTTKAGQQLADIDLLVAAVVRRLSAVIVSADNDFDALPVRRENWREAPPA